MDIKDRPTSSTEVSLRVASSFNPNRMVSCFIFKACNERSFCKRYSDDPSASRNEGVLGWLQWGVTPMNFQSSVWSLDLGKTSNVIETEYGFHLVVVDSIRSSEFSSYDADSYEYAVQRSSLVSVRDLLKDASLAYDREVLSERVVIYEKQINVLFEHMLESKKELTIVVPPPKECPNIPILLISHIFPI